jgi:thiamine biosynthesis lipoprotein
MGTLFRVTLYARGRDAARTALRAGFDEVRRLDEALSDYREDSELNRLCRAPSGKPFAVSEPLFEALSLSQEISGETDGAFDVTLGPLIRLWRQARKQVELPPEPARREALALCGYRKLHLDARARTAALAAPGMQLDLGGIGKGLAADRALHAIVLHGCPAALVAAGGDVRAGDPPPGEPGWKVGVEGLGSGDGFSRILSLTHGAVSTSGDADQFVEIGGVRYSHIVDPRTGLGLTERLTATVMARASARADALATAASVLGVERGMAWLETQEGVEALLLAASGKGYAETATTGFPPRAVTQQAPARY